MNLPAIARRAVVFAAGLIAAIGNLTPASAEPDNDQQAADDGPTIRFVSKAAGPDAIEKAISKARLKSLPRWQLAMETGRPIEAESIEAARDVYRQRLREGVVSFNNEQKQAVRSIIEGFYSPIAENYPRFAGVDWSFIQLRVGGLMELPHTRGRHIFLPARWADRIVMATRSDAPRGFRRYITMLLLHEQVHVFQRANRELFHELYTEVSRFRTVDAIEWPADREWHPISNPDTEHERWIYPIGEGEDKRWVHPRLVTRRIGADFDRRRHITRMGFDVRLDGNVAHIKTDKQGKAKATPLKQIEGYTKAFPAVESNYHPAELAADYLAIMMMRGSLGYEDFRPATKAVTEPLREWAKKRLAK